MEKILELLPLVIPVLIVQVFLAVYALISLKNTKSVLFDNKALWVVIIIVINIFGPIIFLVAGRKDNEDSR